MPPGWHVTTTEQGVYLYPEAHTLTGRWAVEVELFLFPNPGDAGFGIALERAERAPGETQVRFLMRRDGQAAMLGVRPDRDTTFVGWTTDTTATAHTGGVVRYVLRLTHEQGTLAFAINGTEMLSYHVGDGDDELRPGLRVGPGLNVHVSRFDLVTPLAPPRPRRGGM